MQNRKARRRVFRYRERKDVLMIQFKSELGEILSLIHIGYVRWSRQVSVGDTGGLSAGCSAAIIPCGFRMSNAAICSSAFSKSPVW